VTAHTLSKSFKKLIPSLSIDQTRRNLPVKGQPATVASNDYKIHRNKDNCHIATLVAIMQIWR